MYYTNYFKNLIDTVSATCYNANADIVSVSCDEFGGNHVDKRIAASAGGRDPERL